MPHQTLSTVTVDTRRDHVVPVVNRSRATASEALVVGARMRNEEYSARHPVFERRREAAVPIDVGAIAFIVQLLLNARARPDISIPAAGGRPLSHTVHEHPLVVGSTQNSHVVRFEARASPVLNRFPEPVAGFLCDARIEAIAVQRSTTRIVVRLEYPIT